MNYDEIKDEAIVNYKSEPKFSKFLKRKNNKAQEKKIEEDDVFDEYPVEDNLEEPRQDEPKNLKPKQFLKRKSKTIKPQKLE